MTDPRPPLLPFGEIPWEHFESLSLELFAEQHDVVDCRLYGGRGQAQDGIDLYGVTGDGAHVAAQCRRLRELAPSDIKRVVDQFLEGSWADSSVALTFFTAATTESTRIASAIEEARTRLAAAGVSTFTVRDRRRLSMELRSQPELVDAYFGSQVRRAFCTGQDQETARADALAEVVEIQAAQMRRPRLLDTGSLNEAVARAVRRAANEHEDEVALLEVILGDPQPARRARAWIAEPPAPAEQASAAFWVAVARIAERGGEWLAAASGWLRVAKARGGGDVQAIVNAAIAAKVARDEELEAELVKQARAIDADHPKLKLHEVLRIESAQDALDALDGIAAAEDDEAGLQALIELNRALLLARLGQPDEADVAIARATRAGNSESLLQLGVVRANVVVVRNRRARAMGRPMDAQALEQAERGALEVRDKLLAEHRVAESVRALMLAADAAWLRTDYARAGALLDRATGEEIRAEDGAGVLGDAALRYQLPALALKLTEEAEPDADIRRIRAEAKLERRQDVEQARAELRDIALAGGQEAAMAALALCHEAAFGRGAWDAEVAAVVASESPIDAALLEARSLARRGRHDDAQALLAHHAGDDRVRQLRFELAYNAGADEAIDMVSDVLRSNPERRIRLQCAHLLLEHQERGDLARAESETRSVAESPAAGRSERSDAYDLLLVILARSDRWRDAQKELTCWSRVDAGDDRLNVWQVRVGNRLRRS